jgi:hypothetical protein
LAIRLLLLDGLSKNVLPGETNTLRLSVLPLCLLVFLLSADNDYIRSFILTRRSAVPPPYRRTVTSCPLTIYLLLAPS